MTWKQLSRKKREKTWNWGLNWTASMRTHRFHLRRQSVIKRLQTVGKRAEKSQVNTQGIKDTAENARHRLRRQSRFLLRGRYWMTMILKRQKERLWNSWSISGLSLTSGNTMRIYTGIPKPENWHMSNSRQEWLRMWIMAGAFGHFFFCWITNAVPPLIRIISRNLNPLIHKRVRFLFY